jgi:hypothetical protein
LRISFNYQKVWILVTSGEIKLELDLHFENGENDFVVDFKSGFSSNEKGNTNRFAGNLNNALNAFFKACKKLFDIF